MVKKYICKVMQAVPRHKSHSLKSIRWPVFSMVLAILAITGFQGYWLKNNYDREKQNLDINTNAAFRQTILKLQASKLKLDRLIYARDSSTVTNVVLRDRKNPGRRLSRPARHALSAKAEPTITIMNLVQERLRDTLEKYGKDFPMISVKGEVVGFGNDSLHPSKGIAIRTRDNSFSMEDLDSLLDPSMIRRINVDKQKNSNVNTITINYVSNDSVHGLIKNKLKDIREIEDSVAVPVAGVKDVAFRSGRPGFPPPMNNAMAKFFVIADSLATEDSVTLKEVADAYAKRLKEDKINMNFEVSRLDSVDGEKPNAVTVGLTRPATYAFTLQNTFGYMLGKLKLPILFSLLLLGVTIAAFVMLYRNMVKQHRLSQLKNEFISNITHELKTPIATVGVAIEALKNFNALDDPKRTREYLDISQNELQRLNLLVDKVLKLSVFESKAIELKKETFDLKQLTEEIMNSMKLQFEKYKAELSLIAEGGNYTLEADKLHITSVIYNLLDNALKYSQENPVIEVNIASHEEHISISVKDNGIGIPAEYKGKVFEKFFRVPMGDKHNIKGYGLGLSYVSEIASRHQGYITVDSELGKGSTFTLNIPYKEAPVVKFDGQKKIRKEFRFGH
jgi:two-component system phosphate regulon sensor histidine kinase PhoR